MTSYVVVDCSFIMSGLLPDESAHFSDLAACAIYVPALFYLECTNVLMVAVNRGRIKRADFDEYLHILRNLPLSVDHFCSTSEALHSISRLCEKHHLTSYDASYLELAIRLQAKMASKDQRLIKACAEHKIVCV